MRKKFSDLINREAFKMRDVAFGPSVAIAAALPKVLIVIVAISILNAAEFGRQPGRHPDGDADADHGDGRNLLIHN